MTQQTSHFFFSFTFFVVVIVVVGHIHWSPTYLEMTKLFRLSHVTGVETGEGVKMHNAEHECAPKVS